MTPRRLLVLGTATALPLLGLATGAQATSRHYTVTKTIKYAAHQSTTQIVLCHYPDLVTPPSEDFRFVRSSGPAVVSTAYLYLSTDPDNPPGGTSGGLQVTIDNTEGTKGGKLRVYVPGEPD